MLSKVLLLNPPLLSLYPGLAVLFIRVVSRPAVKEAMKRNQDSAMSCINRGRRVTPTTDICLTITFFLLVYTSRG